MALWATSMAAGSSCQRHGKDQLEANTDELMRRGGFGSPTIFIGDDMYFGNDRLPLLAEALRRRAGMPPATAA